jgi:hypothetical protein
MLLILASRHDPHAVRLVRRWRRAAAHLLTCADFSRPGWEFHSGEPNRGRLVVHGRRRWARDVRGVLVRLPVVTAADLPHIDAEDREYVAAELMALLVAFLCELPCPVINRPTPLLLTGPAWTADRWRCEAKRLGMAIGPQRRTIELGSLSQEGCAPLPVAETVTVVGENCFGSEQAQIREFAQHLARQAGVSLLRTRFARQRTRLVFIDADLTPTLEDPEVEGAVLRSLVGNGAAGSKGTP